MSKQPIQNQTGPAEKTNSATHQKTYEVKTVELQALIADMRAWLETKPYFMTIRDKLGQYADQLEGLIVFDDKDVQSYFDEVLTRIIDREQYPNSEDVIVFIQFLEVLARENCLAQLSLWKEPRRWAALSFLLYCWIDADDAIAQISQEDSEWEFVVSELVPQEINIGFHTYTCVWPSEENFGSCAID